MHDELIERRLRDALRTEGDAVALTITGAELERRWTRDRRRNATRPMALLLAAAVGVGLVGAGAIVGGVFDRSTPTPPAPSAPAVVANASPSPSPSAIASHEPVVLPSIEELTAGSDPAAIVLSQAHGPATGPALVPSNYVLEPPAAQLTVPAWNGDLELLFSCLGDGHMAAAIKATDRIGDALEPTTPCDGSVVQTAVRVAGGSVLCLVSDTPDVSWRVAVRRISGAPAVIDGATEPVLQSGERELATVSDTDANWQNQVTELSSAAPELAAEPIPLRAFPATAYVTVRMVCTGSPIRFVIGDGTFGPAAPGTDTTVGCDGLVHDHVLNIDEWAGGQFAVKASPDTQWQVLAVTDQPPIELAGDEPGWQSTGGAGPNYEFSAQADGLSLSAGEKPGPVRIVVSCAGTGVIHVSVDVGLRHGDDTKTFDAPCTSSGETTARTYQLRTTIADVTYDHPARAWTAVAVLIPDPSTAP
jgi:hypothetical protein